MYISGESLMVILLAGLIAGWLAGKIVAGGGFGLIGDIAVGIVGALIGTWLLPAWGSTSAVASSAPSLSPLSAP